MFLSANAIVDQDVRNDFKNIDYLRGYICLGHWWSGHLYGSHSCSLSCFALGFGYVCH